jgi:abortive infection bacteriophage resistance protein
MTKTATNIEEQLDKLISRGLVINDYDKAKEVLLDIGYYRLGFYLFPFEISYPSLRNRTHDFIEGASFEDAIRLYYFDFDLRLLLLRYLNRIEIALRTSIIYNLSNKYKLDNIWFVNSDVVGHTYIKEFSLKVYNADFRKIPTIHRHHRANPNDKFAPAWKTIEFMTFGAVMKLYQELRDLDDKIIVANRFGIRQVVTFENYMHTVRTVRNACAHGLLLYDLKLPMAVRNGPAHIQSQNRNNIIGALHVIKYIMSKVSENRAIDLSSSIRKLYDELCQRAPVFKLLIPDFSQI